MTRILGIDPGSTVTGFGIIDADGHKYEYVACGWIKLAKLSWHLRLKQIYSDVTTIIAKYKPEEAAIEKVFVHKNVSSALKLGCARGVAMVACANMELNIAEYVPRAVKLAVVGYGAAAKEQVQYMVKDLLRLSALPQADAADALAVAMCHAHHLLLEKVT